MKSSKHERNSEIVSAYRAGETSPSLARKHGLTTTMIGKIIKASGLNARDGGAHVSAVRAKKQAKQKSETNRKQICKRAYGCTPEEKTMAEKRKAVLTTQRYREFLRNHKIKPGQLPYPAWVDAWIKSRKSSRIGVGKGYYSMVRTDPKKNWSKENVSVVEFGESIRRTKIKPKQAKTK